MEIVKHILDTVQHMFYDIIDTISNIIRYAKKKL